MAHAVEHTRHYSFKLLNTKISFDLFIFLICCLLWAAPCRVPEMSCCWSEEMTVMLNWLIRSASNSFRLESTVCVRHLLCFRVYGCYLQTWATPVMFCGCSKSALVCSCGLMSSQKVSGAPVVTGSRRVSAAHWLSLAALSAILNGSGRKSGGLSDDPSCPAGGLGYCGIPLTSCACCRHSICPVCLYPCCLVCSGLCGLFHCWKRNTVFFGTLQLWISCGSQSCVSPYWCCSQSVFLKADACQSCSCPCCSRPGESCPSAFQYLRVCSHGCLYF